MLRQLMLRLASEPRVRAFVTNDGAARRFAARFVAGETLDEALAVTRRLNERGLAVTLDHLGENTTNREEAAAAAQAYVTILDRLAAERLNGNVSLKLTQLGLDVDEEMAAAGLERVVARAHELASFVRIDMESSAYTQRTLSLFRRVYRTYPANVGPVIQTYLYRSERDLRTLIRLGARVRLCKGAYAEPPDVAFPNKRDADRNYVRLMELLLLLGRYPAIATHDARIIRHARRFVDGWQIERDQFEFQMLYGVRRDLQVSLVDAGYRVRVYVPYGTAWYPYLTRRLAERPANTLFVLGSLVREALPGQ